LDNGQPFTTGQVTEAKLEKSLQVEQKILGRLEMATAQVEDVQLEKTCEYDLILAPSQEVESLKMREQISLIWTIPDTAALVKEFIPTPSYHADSTFDRSGNLKVIMKKTNGTWAWNPFGW